MVCTDIVVCTDVDAGGNNVADGVLARLISPLLGRSPPKDIEVSAGIVVCTGVDVGGNEVGDSTVARLVDPLLGRPPPDDIEVSAEITLTKVDGEDARLCPSVVEVCTTPTESLPDALFDATG